MHVVYGMTYQGDCGGAKTAVPLLRQTINKDKKV